MNIFRAAKLLIPILQHRPAIDSDLPWETMPAYTDDPQTGNGEVRIGGIDFPVLDGQVNALNLARFQAKVTFGDYDLDSDPLLSSQILSNFSGGMGNETLKEGVDDDTFWDATLETRYPDGPTLLPLTTVHAGVPIGDTAVPLGDFPASNPSFLAAFDLSLQRWDEVNDVFVAVATPLNGEPVSYGVEFESEFYIPLGAAGYNVMTTSDVVTHFTDFHPLQFIVWDRKLMAMTVEGVLWMKPPGGVWAVASAGGGDAVTIPSGDRPRKMVNFINTQGQPTLHIVTDSKVYAYDQDGEELYETRLDFPKHPNQGLGAANWRGDTMFVSVGTGIHGYNGSTITAMGPDGRHGLPSRLRGTIVDLQPEYNALLALVRGQGTEIVTEGEDTFSINPPMYRDNQSYATGIAVTREVHSCILRWSNSQWHKVWESESASGDPTWMVVSQASGAYRLWWGYGGEMHSQQLQISFQNPKQGLQSGSMAFAPTGFLITGWFDANMTAFTKLAAHVEVNLEDVLEGHNEPGGSVTIQYQYNTSGAWRTLGVADTVGKTILPFQNRQHSSGIMFSDGLAFRRIRFKLVFNQKAGETLLSPLLSSMVFKFIKIPESQLSWSFTVPLTTQDGYKGNGNNSLASKLEAALYDDVFTDFVFQGTVYRVRVAQTVGNRHTGYDDRGDYQVNLVEVSLGSTRDENTVIKYTDVAPETT